MPSQAPSPLYCMPSDLFDYLGTEGAQLRLDDHQLATGQTISLTATAALGATTLATTALQYPLLAGSVLEFDGGGTPTVVEAILSSTAPVGATALNVAALPAAIQALAQATDSGVNLATGFRLLKGCYYGTSTVNDYCTNRYDVTVLTTSWTVNRWATCLAAKWVASRRGNAAPGSILQDAKDALDELKQVRTGMFCISGCGTRTSGWPVFTNVRLDLGYDYAKLRVEPNISEGTPTQYAQYIDWDSVLSIEFN